MRVAVYVWLTTFIRPTRAQSESGPSDRLWLLPWHEIIGDEGLDPIPRLTPSG
jgi:hypothetical protein